MKDKWEEKLFQMAEREVLEIPESLTDKIDSIVQMESKKKIIFHMNWKKAVLLSAALVLVLSVTVSAAVLSVKQRMEQMNHQKIEAYYTQIQESRLGSDNYNRPMTESEKTRLSELADKYENESLFPEGELKMLEEAKAYKKKGVAFLSKTSTFFFPDEEMNDEELLQIIDFRYKRDYSLLKMNEMIAAGEVQPPKQTKEKVQTTDKESIAKEAVYSPAQELTISYTGSLTPYYIAAGQNCIFLAENNVVHRMEIGESDSTLFFDGFGEKETRILSICQDKEGMVYIGVWQWSDEEPEKKEPAVWIVDEKGSLQKVITMEVFASDTGYGILGQMAVDRDGYLYVRFSGGVTAKSGKDSALLIYDKEGNWVTEVDFGAYDASRLGGLCLGKDGKIYTQIERFDNQTHHLGIACVNRSQGCLEEIYFDIVPEDTIMLDIVAPGSDTDFVFWGYDGIFTYNLGDESAVNVLPAYEAPCQWEGVRRLALPDGRIVFGDGSNPEQFYFYYKSTVQKDS